MRSVVVTGATSMIGIALTEACLAEGCRVAALVREDSSNMERLPESENLQVVYCSLDRLNHLNLSATGGYDVFYHLAWSHTDKAGRNDVQLQQRNIRYTLDALNLAKRLGCKKFVGAGSQAEYGIHVESKTGPDSPVNPQTAYGVCKYAAGKLGAVQAGQLGMDFFWVRIFSVYGRYDMAETMISSSLQKMKRGEHCSFTPGTHQWDYLYSSDAGKAFYLIGEKAMGNKIYCLGSGQGKPLREYIEEMRDVVNPELELGFGEIPYADGKGMDMCADIHSLCQDTGWKPETEFRRGILQLAAHSF